MLARAITLVCFGLCLIAAQSSASRENPGVTYKVTDTAFNLVSEALLTRLKREIDSNPFMIPDQCASDSSSNYSITAIDFKLYTIPRSKFSFQPPDEIIWSLKDIDLSFSGDWSYVDHLRFIRLRDKGWGNVSISGLSVDVRVRLGRNDNDQLTLAMTRCSALVEKVSLKVEGAFYHVIYKLLLKLGFLKGKLKRKIRFTVCDFANNTIKKINDGFLAAMPTKYPVFSTIGYGPNELVFDYGLKTGPVVTKDHIQMNHNGGFLWVGDPVDSLLEAPKISLPPSKSMLSAAETDYPFDSLSDAIMRSNYSSFYLTQETFPDRSGSPLETTCDKQLICFGSFVPEIAESYPNRSLTMLLELTTRPDLTIEENLFTITSAQRISFNVTEPSGTGEPAVLSVESSISVTGTAHIANNTLFGELISVKLVFSSASSPVIENTVEFLKSLNQRTEDNLAFLVPLANDLTAGGFEIPTTYESIGLRAANALLAFIPGNIILNVDFDLYLPPNVKT